MESLDPNNAQKAWGSVQIPKILGISDRFPRIIDYERFRWFLGCRFCFRWPRKSDQSYAATKFKMAALQTSNEGKIILLLNSNLRKPRRDIRLPTSDFRLLTSDFGLRTSDFRLQTSDFRLPTSDFRLQTLDFRLQTSDFRLQTSDFRLPTSDFGLRTSDFGLQT